MVKIRDVLTEHELLRVESLKIQMLRSTSLLKAWKYKKEIEEILIHARERFLALSPEERERWVKKVELERNKLKLDGQAIERLIPPMEEVISKEEMDRLRELLESESDKDRIEEIYDIIMRAVIRNYLKS